MEKMMTLEMTPAEKASQMLRNRPLKSLIEEFIMTGWMNDPHIPTVRGWYMDELKRRYPVAYDAWLDDPQCRDEDLYKYFNI